MKGLIGYVGFGIIILSIFVFYGIFNLSKYWHVLIGITILHLLLVELQMLGWTAKKQGIGTKITFLLALVSNSSLAFIFIFKISALGLKPLLIAASIVSVLSLLYGLFIYQSKKTIDN